MEDVSHVELRRRKLELPKVEEKLASMDNKGD